MHQSKTCKSQQTTDDGAMQNKLILQFWCLGRVSARVSNWGNGFSVMFWHTCKHAITGFSGTGSPGIVISYHRLQAQNSPARNGCSGIPFCKHLQIIFAYRFPISYLRHIFSWALSPSHPLDITYAPRFSYFLLLLSFCVLYAQCNLPPPLICV